MSDERDGVAALDVAKAALIWAGLARVIFVHSQRVARCSSQLHSEDDADRTEDEIFAQQGDVLDLGGVSVMKLEAIVRTQTSKFSLSLSLKSFLARTTWRAAMTLALTTVSTANMT